MEISSVNNSPLIAVAKDTSYMRIEGQIALYNLNNGHCQLTFPVHYDFGGRRLSLSLDAALCIVGCYNSYGLAAYRNTDGSELWRRRDLKAVQRVHPLPFDDLVFCGREGSGHLLSTNTGLTIEKFRGVKAMYSDPMGINTIVCGRTLDLHSRFGRRIKKIARVTFAELSCFFSPSEVLISEAGGDVRCFDSDTGEEIWSHSPPRGSHFLRLCFSQPLNCFLGIRWHYLDRSDPVKRIVHFERQTGTVLNDVELGIIAEHEFCLNGMAVFTSDFQLVSAETGMIIREFEKF